MKHLYTSIGLLIMSLAFLYYADQVQADSIMSNQCNKNCGSVANCEIGADYLQSGWTDCEIDIYGDCNVYGSFCSGGNPGDGPGEIADPGTP
jgi:hypothetical protein